MTDSRHSAGLATGCIVCPSDRTGHASEFLWCAAGSVAGMVLHQRLVPDRQHRRMNVHHDVIRFRKRPQRFRLGAVEEVRTTSRRSWTKPQSPRPRPGGSSSTMGRQSSSTQCALAISATHRDSDRSVMVASLTVDRRPSGVARRPSDQDFAMKHCSARKKQHEKERRPFVIDREQQF